MKLADTNMSGDKHILFACVCVNPIIHSLINTIMQFDKPSY